MRKRAHRSDQAPDSDLAAAPETSKKKTGGKLARIGVAIEEDLLEKFDSLITQRNYTNRSEAFRDLIRAELKVETVKDPEAEVVGSLTMVYDHHVRMLSDKLLDLQHEFHEAILSTLHVHLDHDNCLEVLLIRGPAGRVSHIANALISTKGVKHGKLTVTATGGEL